MAGRTLCVLVGWMAMFTALTTLVASTPTVVMTTVTPGPDICALVPDASCRTIIPKLCYQGSRHSVTMVNHTESVPPRPTPSAPAPTHHLPPTYSTPMYNVSSSMGPA